MTSGLPCTARPISASQRAVSPAAWLALKTRGVGLLMREVSPADPEGVRTFAARMARATISRVLRSRGGEP
jgi:hypothetical protein